MTNDNLAGGMPMNLEQIRFYLQKHCGIPIVLREQGTVHIKCPHCLKLHEHGPQPGHHVAGCDDDDRFNGIGIVIGKRHFIPNYGYTIMECIEKEGANMLITL